MWALRSIFFRIFGRFAGCAAIRLTLDLSLPADAKGPASRVSPRRVGGLFCWLHAAKCHIPQQRRTQPHALSFLSMLYVDELVRVCSLPDFSYLRGDGFFAIFVRLFAMRNEHGTAPGRLLGSTGDGVRKPGKKSALWKPYVDSNGPQCAGIESSQFGNHVIIIDAASTAAFYMVGATSFTRSWRNRIVTYCSSHTVR